MNRATIPAAVRAGQRKRIAAVQVLAEELGNYYQKQEPLNAVEVAQMTGILKSLGLYAKELIDAALIVQDSVGPSSRAKE
jgi:ABC-type enterochelin transport system ATPase subunit